MIRLESECVELVSLGCALLLPLRKNYVLPVSVRP